MYIEGGKIITKEKHKLETSLFEKLQQFVTDSDKPLRKELEYFVNNYDLGLSTYQLNKLLITHKCLPGIYRMVKINGIYYVRPIKPRPYRHLKNNQNFTHLSSTNE